MIRNGACSRQVALQAKLWACTPKPHVTQVGEVRDHPFLEDFLAQLTGLLLFSGILLFKKLSLFLLITLRPWCSLCPQSQEPGIWCPLNLGPWPVTNHVSFSSSSLFLDVDQKPLYAFSLCEAPHPFPPSSLLLSTAELTSILP